MNFSSSVQPRLDLQLSPAGAPSQRPKAAESGQAPQCLHSYGPGSLAHVWHTVLPGCLMPFPSASRTAKTRLLPQLSPCSFWDLWTCGLSLGRNLALMCLPWKDEAVQDGSRQWFPTVRWGSCEDQRKAHVKVLHGSQLCSCVLEVAPARVKHVNRSMWWRGAPTPTLRFSCYSHLRRGSRRG